MNILFSLITSIAFGSSPEDYQVGDVIMQSDEFKGSAAAIKTLTLSKYNHVGVVIEINDNLYIAEALATVRYTPIDVYIERGKDYKHLRLKKELTDIQKKKITKSIKKHKGKKYDPFLSWSDDRMYCSELVAKVYEDADVEIVRKKRTIGSHVLISFSLPVIKSGFVKVPDLYAKGINDIQLSDISVTPADIRRSTKLRQVN